MEGEPLFGARKREAWSPFMQCRPIWTAAAAAALSVPHWCLPSTHPLQDYFPEAPLLSGLKKGYWNAFLTR